MGYALNMNVDASNQIYAHNMQNKIPKVLSDGEPFAKRR